MIDTVPEGLSKEDHDATTRELMRACKLVAHIKKTCVSVDAYDKYVKEIRDIEERLRELYMKCKYDGLSNLRRIMNDCPERYVIMMREESNDKWDVSLYEKE